MWGKPVIMSLLKPLHMLMALKAPQMSEVHVKENESLDNALKRFKRSCAKAGVLSDLRKKEYYQSPSVKRRKKSEAARKNKNKRYY